MKRLAGLLLILMLVCSLSPALAQTAECPAGGFSVWMPDHFEEVQPDPLSDPDQCFYWHGKKLAVLPILRAGLGMVDGILAMCPSAKVGHIGLCRDEITHLPHEYFCKLPDHIDERIVIVPDPMLATGGSAADAVNILKRKGCKDIRFMCIIAAPEGLQRLQKEHPDIKIYVGCVDDHLNENAYIVPGLGDAGDRIFGTK